MRILKRFILMVQFFTTIPIRKRLDVTDEDFGKGLIFAPLVGLILGFILLGIFLLAELIFSIKIAPIFIIVFYVMLTGGLHLDGLGDTFDGVFSRRPKERIIEIMRDSRVGTNAVLVVILVILLNVFFLFQFERPELIKIIILFPVMGRVGSLIGCSISKYATDKGLGKSFVDHCLLKEAVIGNILVLGISYLVLGIMGIILLGYSILTAIIVTMILRRKLGGVTGDILGAVCEINQVLFFIGSFILLYSV